MIYIPVRVGSKHEPNNYKDSFFHRNSEFSETSATPFNARLINVSTISNVSGNILNKF